MPRTDSTRSASRGSPGKGEVLEGKNPKSSGTDGADASPRAQQPPPAQAADSGIQPNGTENSSEDGPEKIWEQCRPLVVKDTLTGKRVIKAKEYWMRGQAKLRAGDETCVDDFGKAIHLDILAASFFRELIPAASGSPGSKLPEFIARAVDEPATARQGRDLVYPLLARAYITFLFTATPQLRGLIDSKAGAQVVRVSSDRAVAADPDDARLRVIRAGFLSQLGGPRSTSTVSSDARKAVELADAQIKAIEDDPSSYIGGPPSRAESEDEAKPRSSSKAAKKKKKQREGAESARRLTPEAEEKIAWLRLQRAHGNLQLGDIHWGLKKSKTDRNLAETHLKAYVNDASECDPDMYSACYKLAVLSLWNIPNPKKVNIAPNLVRANPEKIQPGLTWYKKAVAAQELHHSWLPAGMDEQAVPMARTWLKVISRVFSQEPPVKPNPLVPHPGLKCENLHCPSRAGAAPKENSGVCGSCLWANYCSKSCQVADWKIHKQSACKEARGITVINFDGECLKQ